MDEFARYDTPFDEDAVGVTAEYTLNDDGTVRVAERGRSEVERNPHLDRGSCPGSRP